MSKLRVGRTARRREPNLRNEFTRLERCRKHAEKVVIRRNLAASRHNRGTETHDCCRVIGRRIVVCQRATDRPAIPDLGIADARCQVGQRRQSLANVRIIGNVRVRRHGAEDQRRFVRRNTPKLVDTRKINEAGCLGHAQLQRGQQRHATGDGHGHVIVCQQGSGSVDAVRALVDKVIHRDLSLPANTHRSSARLDGANDVLVSGAATQVSVQPLPYVLVVRVRISRNQVNRAHDHARRAKSALQSVVFPECRLHWMQFTFNSQPFDGRNISAFGLQRQHRATLDRATVDVNDACPTLAGIATDVRTGELQVFAQYVNEQGTTLNVSRDGLAVYSKRYAVGHRNPVDSPTLTPSSMPSA